jgi:NTP pyrophosphatase (non-canonical NTP hydrolase)
MDLNVIRETLRSIPEIVDPQAGPPPPPGDLLGSAEDFAKVLRKLGVQQMRDTRELLAGVQGALGESGEIRDAWQKERQRATESERQLKALARVMIDTLDILDRMHSTFHSVGGMEDWARQVEQALEVCFEKAERVGLVPLGKPGEEFDEAVHDSPQPLPPGRRRPKVTAVSTRGYALNGQILRRATVEAQS